MLAISIRALAVVPEDGRVTKRKNKGGKIKKVGLPALCQFQFSSNKLFRQLGNVSSSYFSFSTPNATGFPVRSIPVGAISKTAR